MATGGSDMPFGTTEKEKYDSDKAVKLCTKVSRCMEVHNTECWTARDDLSLITACVNLNSNTEEVTRTTQFSHGFSQADIGKRWNQLKHGGGITAPPYEAIAKLDPKQFAPPSAVDVVGSQLEKMNIQSIKRKRETEDEELEELKDIKRRRNETQMYNTIVLSYKMAVGLQKSRKAKQESESMK